MGSGQNSRLTGLSKAGIASLAVAALAVPLGVWIISTSPAPESEISCDVLEAEDPSEASLIAAHCRADVEVLSERTPWNTTYVKDDGTNVAELSAMPVRVEANGEWVDLDTDLVENEATGEIEVAAPVYPMQFNSGDEIGARQPLGSIQYEDHFLDVWFPLDLPEPTIVESEPDPVCRTVSIC